MQIKRYKFDYDDSLIEAEDGGIVYYEDIAPLLEERPKLTERDAKRVASMQAYLDDTFTEDWTKSEQWLSEMIDIIRRLTVDKGLWIDEKVSPEAEEYIERLTSRDSEKGVAR